jgi:hypothetical protein
MAAAAKQRVREFLDEQTQKLVTLRDEGVSMTTPGAKAGETILRLLDTKCCTEWRPESFAYPIVVISCMRLQVFQDELLRHFLYASHFYM